MYVVGLTGGIGSGKSTFASLLAERGAQIIDADEIGRDALRTGTPAWHSVVDTFGDEILAPHTMNIDRARLADIVFNDRNKLAALNAIVHPVILGTIADHLERLRATDDIVVLDAALLIEMGVTDQLDALVVVTASDEVRKARLVNRGLRPDDIDARMANQASKDRLLEKADIVVTNDGTPEQLAEEAERVWQQLEERKNG